MAPASGAGARRSESTDRSATRSRRTVRPAAGLSAIATEGQLRWYQLQLPGMQQEIFFGRAPAREAFNEVGMCGIEAMFADDRYGFGPETIGAWRRIADGRETGDESAVAADNRTLLLREQQHIIDDDDTRTRDRPITGRPQDGIEPSISVRFVDEEVTFWTILRFDPFGG